MKSNSIIKEIKYSRLKPEERFLINMLLNLKEYVSDRYPDFIFYKKDNEILFHYNLKSHVFFCDYNKIWSIFETKYHLNDNKIKELIKGIVEEYLKFKNVTPNMVLTSADAEVEKHLKLKDVTPYYFSYEPWL